MFCQWTVSKHSLGRWRGDILSVCAAGKHSGGRLDILLLVMGRLAVCVLHSVGRL